MAQLLAPYNNAMRLGQGFNSYTQQICLDKAVTIDPNWRPTAARTENVVLGTAKRTSEENDEEEESEAYAIMDKFEKQAEKNVAKQNREYEEMKAEAKQKERKKEREAKGLTDEDDAAAAEAPPQTVEGSEGQAADTTAVARRVPKKKDVVKENFDYVEGESLEVHPWVKPQIVTYTSKFVDKLSDVTDSMNISGSLSIKTAQIGGKANGSYLDSDKFKSSDINFFLQVKVTNQIHNAPEYSVFQHCAKVSATSFPEVYGDSFISGWEEGGELNAVISVKVRDKSNIFKIKAGLEAELSTPGISGKVTANLDLDKTTLNRETETTITVNWSGGGSIKDPTKDWGIGTLKQAAAAFPELVAITPQRTYAILTKYTSLTSFQLNGFTYDPLEYENAGLYTNALLDAFMDYKVMWKQISTATDEFEAGRASIELGQPSEEIYQQAIVKVLAAEQADVRLMASRVKKLREKGEPIGTNSEDEEAKKIKDSSDDVDTPTSDGTAGTPAFETQTIQLTNTASALSSENEKEKKGTITYTVFKSSFVGLIQARRVCRFEMSKIVNEVGLVAKDPRLATDTTRDSYFLHPLVFKQLLPVVRSLSPENARMGIKDANAAVLLGYCAPDQGDRKLPSIHDLSCKPSDLPLLLQESMQKNSYKADDYRMEGCVGKVENIHSNAEMFNSLNQLDPTYRPSVIAIFTKMGQLVGIRMEYLNGNQIESGFCDSQPYKSISLKSDGSEAITQVTIHTLTDENKKVEIVALELATSSCQTLSSIPTLKEQGLENIEKAPAGESQSKNAQTTEAEQSTPKATGPAKKPRTAAIKSYSWAKKDDSTWSVRGFFGFKMDKAILTLGVIWGKDNFIPVPMGRVPLPLAKDFLCQSALQQAEIQRITTLKTNFLGKFLMGNVLKTVSGSEAGTIQEVKAGAEVHIFNALDTIDITWKMKSLAFASKDRKLTGIKVTYQDGTEIIHGHYYEQMKTWNCDTKRPLISVKLSAGKLKEDARTYVTSLEFIRGDLDGKTPEWLFDVSTLRYLGEGEEGLIEPGSVVEAAPKIKGAVWTVRGFYGEYSDTQLTQLGIIWGRG